MRVARTKRQAVICRYLSYTYPGGRQLRLPMAHLRVGHNGVSLRTAGLIDSGDTSTFIPVWIREALDLPVQETSSAIGAGGSFPIQVCHADLEVLKGMRPVFSVPDAKVMVPADQGAIPYAVLGRDLLFNQYRVVFEERDLRTVLRSY